MVCVDDEGNSEKKREEEREAMASGECPYCAALDSLVWDNREKALVCLRCYRIAPGNPYVFEEER